jgi:Uma2 family endonuclease
VEDPGALRAGASAHPAAEGAREMQFESDELLACAPWLRHNAEPMPRAARRRYSFHEYVLLEEYSNVRHEYLDGVIYAMPGGSPRHAALAARIIRILGAQLAGRPCEVFTSDLRVRVKATGLGTYPDVTAVCGKIERDPEEASFVVNPSVLFEVLSDSTEEYDRGEKLDHYRQIAAAREIVLVSHCQPRLEIWRRNAAGPWSSVAVEAGACARLGSIGCEIAVDDFYRDLPDES